MPLSSLEGGSYSLDGTPGFRPREPRFGLLRLGDRAPGAALAGAPDELDTQREVRDPHSHRLEERNVVRVQAPAAGSDEPGERQDPVPAARRIARHELARELLHARQIVDRDPRRAVED